MSIIKLGYYPLEQNLTILPGKELGQKNNLQPVLLPEAGLNSGALAGTNSSPSRQAFEKIKGRGILPRKIRPRKNGTLLVAQDSCSRPLYYERSEIFVTLKM